jgi:heat shock protein HslJ
MRKLLVALLTAATVLAILAGGCGASKTADTGTHSLADTSWVLVSYGYPAHLTTALLQVKVTLSFNADTTQISGNGGVNGYGGDARRVDNQLTLSGILHTEMASINQAVNEQESAYFQLLGAARSVEFGNNTLTIHCEGGQALVFNALER